MSTALGLRDAVLKELSARLPAGTSVATHGGRLDAAELQRISASAPAVYIAVLGVDDVEQQRSGSVEARLVLGLFLVARPRPGRERDAANLLLLSAALRLVAGNLWGLENVNLPSQLRAQNLYSGTIDKRALSLWGITWRQSITLSAADDEALMDNPPQHVGDESPPHPPNSHGKQATRLLPADSKKSVEGKK